MTVERFPFDGKAYVAAAVPDTPELLEQAGLAGLPEGAPLADVEAALRRLQELLVEADPLRRASAREAALRAVKAAGVQRPGALVDAALADASRTEDQAKAKGTALEFLEPDPWPEPVDGAALLDEIAALLSRYVVLPAGAAETIALWVVSTWTTEAFDHSAYLGLVSPERRCGKSTARAVVAAMVNRPLVADNVSPAALYRVVEEHRPTLLIDELDRLPRDHDLWQILNSGHRRDGVVVRVVGEDLEARTFATWGPKLLAYIRTSRPNVPATIEDRTIRVTLRRQGRAERRPRLRSRELASLSAPIRRRLARWADDHLAALCTSSPEIPEALDDRAADSWEALLAIADAAGGPWPARARQAAVELSGERLEEEAEVSIGVRLLADLAELIDSGRLDAQSGIGGEDAAMALQALPDRPWKRWPRGKGDGLTAAALARLLKPYDLRSQQVVSGPRRLRRYETPALLDVISRYVTTPPGEGGEATRYPLRGASEGPGTHSPAGGSDAERPGEATRYQPANPLRSQPANPLRNPLRANSLDSTQVAGERVRGLAGGKRERGSV